MWFNVSTKNLRKSQVAGHWPWKDLHFLLSIWILRCKSRVQGLEWAGDVRIGQLFHVISMLFLHISTNSGESNLPLHDSFFL